MKTLNLEVELINTLVERKVRVKTNTVDYTFKNRDELRYLLSKVVSSLFEEVLGISSTYGESVYNLKEVVFGNESNIEHYLYVEFKNGTKEKFSIITTSEENPSIEGTYHLIQKSIVDTVDKVKKIIAKYPSVTGVKTGSIELDI